MTTPRPTAETLGDRIQELEQRLESTTEQIKTMQRERLFARQLVEMAQAIILVLDPRGRIVWFNPHFSAITGYLLPEVTGKDWFSIFTVPTDREVAMQQFEQAITRGPGGVVFSTILTKTGQVRYIEWHDTLIEESGENHLLGVGQDITEKRRMEGALVWQSQLNAALAELSTALIHPGSVDDIAALVLGHASRLTQSPLGFVGYVEKKTGHLVCPAVLMSECETMPPIEQPQIFQLSGGIRGWVLTHREPVVTNSATQDPRVGPLPGWHPAIARFISVPALMNETLVGQIALANSCRDYSEKDLSLLKRMASLYALALHHKQMDDTIEMSEERFKTIFRESPVGIRLYDMNGAFMDANPACLEIFGIRDKCHLKGVNLFDNLNLSATDMEKLDAGVPIRFEKAYAIADIEPDHADPPPKTDFLYLDITICRMGTQSPSAFQGYLSMTHDVTAKKKTELALRESQKKLRHLSSSLLKAQEQERSRLSYGLHDELGQALAVLKLQISTALHRVHGRDVPDLPECEAVFTQLDAVIENTRRLSRGLSPTILDNLGLTAAIRWLVKDFSEHHGLNIRLDLSDIDGLFPRESEIIIYRIIQESFRNIVKHASALRVDLSVRRRRNRIRFHIQDNGMGFDMAEVNQRQWPEKGLGLTAMEERARILGCPLRRLSRKGRGTTINFSVPINEVFERGVEDT